MKDSDRKMLKKLEKASREGVLLYQGESLATPNEIVNTLWVREEMAYVPDFIVLDEAGKVTEIWYGKGKKPVKNEKEKPPVNRI